jgi:hypothetical protein
MTRASTQARISWGSGRTDADWALLQAVADAQALVERGDVRPAGQRHGHSVRASRTQTGHFACPDEKLQDVRRVIRERRRGIIVPCHDATVPTAIGLDAPANKLHRILLHEAPLPGF